MNDKLRRRNRLFVVGLLVVVGGMVGLTYASVPLYALYCRVTGFGGTTQRANAAPGATGDRVVAIHFNADVNGSLPWTFTPPEEHEVKLKLGETGYVSFHVKNNGTEPTVGTALYNVTPDKAGLFFNKIQCFCFTEQVLQPGQEADMPVAFFVDPSLATDPGSDDISTITLSYTFFRAKDEKKILATKEAEDRQENGKAAAGATATN